MPNTIIQIRKSSANNTPANGSLASGELAYSFLSDKLFIGNTAGSGVLEIGGRSLVIQANAAFAKANAALPNATGTFAGTLTISNDLIVTGNANFDSGALFVDAVNNRVGIGTTNPTSNLHVIGTANITSNLIVGTTNIVPTIKAAYDFANTRYSSSGGTITGDVNIVGNLTLSGTTLLTNVNTFVVNDPLIYLAGNNYTSDIVDIGFIANYVNATGANVHTGLYREHVDKMYYLFQGYDQEPINNHIGALSNNMTLAVLNADLRTSNLLLGGANAITWITSAFAKANAALPNATGTFAGTLTISNDLFVTGNVNFDSGSFFVDATNNRVGIGTTTPTANLQVIGTANVTGNLSVGGLTVGGVDVFSGIESANASKLTTGTVPSGRLTGAYTGITGVGTITQGVWNGSTITVPYGGTGLTTVTTNGILFGNAAGDLKVTAAGTEGQVLQALSTGVPQFAMLDGGTF